MCGTTVLDKDGISAAVVTAEMTAYLVSQGTTVLRHLSHLHDKSVCFSCHHNFCYIQEFFFDTIYSLVILTLMYLQSSEMLIMCYLLLFYQPWMQQGYFFSHTCLSICLFCFGCNLWMSSPVNFIFSMQVLWLSDEHLTLVSRYGYHVSKNSYFLCYDRETIKRLFDKLRNYEGPGKVCCRRSVSRHLV